MKFGAKIIEIFEAMQEDGEYIIRPEYSGRGMYGSTCVGVIISVSSAEFIMDFVKTATEYVDDQYELYELLEDMGKPSQDNMGKDSIIYFPKLKGLKDLLTSGAD